MSVSARAKALAAPSSTLAATQRASRVASGASAPVEPPEAGPPMQCGCSVCRSKAEAALGAPEAPNTAPLAVADRFAASAAAPIVLDVLANDGDADGDALTITRVAGQAIAVGDTVVLASGSTVTLTADMRLVYAPGAVWSSLGAGEAGQERFTYAVSDGRGGTAEAAVTVDVVQPPANRPPVATDDAAVTAAGAAVAGDVLANDGDPDGDPLAVVAVNGSAAAVGKTITLASGARLRLEADGSYAYDPNGAFGHLAPGETATDGFSYTVSDGRGGTAVATVSVTVTGAAPPQDNRAPVAAPDDAATEAGAIVTGNVLLNDADPDGDPLAVVAVNGIAAAVGQVIELASGARLVLRANGSFGYEAPPGFQGLGAGQSATDSFTYTVADGRGGTATATVEVSVAGIAAPDPAAPPYYVADLLAAPTQRWNAGADYGTAVSVTFAFLDEVPGYYRTGDQERQGFRAFTEAQRADALKALGDIASYANIAFVETADAAKAAITFGSADLGSATGWAYYPSPSGVGGKGGDVWLHTAHAGTDFADGTFRKMLLLHEIGHALGLSHTGVLAGIEDTRQYTVMSYERHGTAAEPSTLMPYDIAALQYLYGANTASRTGDTVYRTADLMNRTVTIWDAGGSDTFDLRGATSNLVIDLRPGHFSTIASNGRSNNVAIAEGTLIEKAIGGSGNDVITANEVDNVLTGSAGRDVFRFLPSSGRDIVTDFVRGVDLIDLGLSVARFEEIEIRKVAGGIEVAHGMSEIVLPGLDDLGRDDFVFGLFA